MNSPVEIGFDHRYVAGTGDAARVTLLLLHGTGGDGDSLLQLGYMLYPGATLLSPTGNVLENGAPRFFRRLAEGVFDLTDLREQTDALARFVRGAVGAYGLDAGRVVAVGYSNGANIASSVLLTFPGVLAGAVLYRPMLPFTPEPTPDLRGTSVLLCRGTSDRMSAPASVDALTEVLRGAGADVTVHVERGGHELTMGDVRTGIDWLARYFPATPPAA